jgi:hypothetical protein
MPPTLAAAKHHLADLAVCKERPHAAWLAKSSSHAAGGDDVAAALRLQPTHDGRAHHAAVAGHKHGDLGGCSCAALDARPARHARAPSRRRAARRLQVFGHHLGTHLLRGDLGHPAQLVLGLGRVTQQGFHLGRTEVARVDAHTTSPGFSAGALSPVMAFDSARSSTPCLQSAGDAQFGRCPADELAHRILHAGGDDESSAWSCCSIIHCMRT